MSPGYNLQSYASPSAHPQRPGLQDDQSTELLCVLILEAQKASVSP